MELKYKEHEENVYGIYDMDLLNITENIAHLKCYADVIDYAGKNAAWDMLSNIHIAKLHEVETDLKSDLRIGIKTIFQHLDWIFDPSDKVGSYKFACNLEGRNWKEDLRSMLFYLVKSKHLTVIRSSLGSSYDEWSEDVKNKLPY